MSYRIGTGFDVHPLVSGNEIVLAGVAIPCEYKIDAYSDGDVLSHAICDALLGALVLKDIGHHFPSGNPAFKNVSGQKLIESTLAILGATASFEICNLDTTIILQEPKLQPYINDIRSNLSSYLKIDVELVSVKATTTDHLGIIGSGNAIAAQCATLLEIK